MAMESRSLEAASPQSANAHHDGEDQEMEAAIAASLAEEKRHAEERLAEDKRHAEELRVQRGKALLAEQQPPPGVKTARLSLRLPSGDRMQRAFEATQMLSDVYEWAHCCRSKAEPYNFALCTNFPTKTLSDKTA